MAGIRPVCLVDLGLAAMTAGKMRQKLHFQRRGPADDGYGNPQSGKFETVFTDYAELIPLKGGEPVIAARLTGTQPYVIRIRSSARSREVVTSWRAVDARDTSRVFNITAVANFDQKNAYLDMTATQGVAT